MELKVRLPKQPSLSDDEAKARRKKTILESIILDIADFRRQKPTRVEILELSDLLARALQSIKDWLGPKIL